MSISDLTIKVDLKRRSMLSRVVRFPFVFNTQYENMRKHGNSVVLSICASWLLCGHVIQIGKTKQNMDGMDFL